MKILNNLLIFGVISLFCMSCQKSELSVDGGSGSGEYEQGSVVQIFANPAKEGLKFYRWDGDYDLVKNRFQENTSVNIEKKSVYLKAIYVSLNETYSLNVIGGAGSGEYHAGEYVTLISDSPIPPEEFYRWLLTFNLDDLNLSPEMLKDKEVTFIMPPTDLTIEAKFEILYILYVNGGEGTGKYPEGTSIQISANPAQEGYIFDAWTGDVENIQDATLEKIRITMPPKNLSLEATYKLEPKYNLQIINGTGSGSYKVDSRIRISANKPQSGYEFSEWTGDTDILANTTYKTHFIYMPDRNIILEAKYLKTLDFKVVVNDGTGDGRYEKEEIVTIEADIKDDSYFSHWEGDVDLLENKLESKTSFTMPARAVTFTAIYQKDSFRLGAIEHLGTIEGQHTAADMIVYKNKIIIAANSFGGYWQRHGTTLYELTEGNLRQVYKLNAESLGYLSELNGELWIPTEHGRGIYIYNGTNAGKRIGQADGWSISGAVLNGVYYSGFNGDLGKAHSVMYASDGRKITMPTRNLPWWHATGKNNMLVLGFRGPSFLFNGSQFQNINQSDQLGAATYWKDHYYAGSFSHNYGAMGKHGRFYRIDPNSGAQTLLTDIGVKITDMKVVSDHVVFTTEVPFRIYAYNGIDLYLLHEGGRSDHNGWGHAFCEYEGYLYFAEGGGSGKVQVYRAKIN